MMNILCLLVPSILFGTFYKPLTDKMTWVGYLTAFSIQVIFSNIITFAVLIFMSGKDYVLYLETSPISFVLKMLIFNVLSNLLVYLISINICKKFTFRLKWISEEKEG